MLPIRQSLRAEDDLERIFCESIALLGKVRAEPYLACVLRAIGILQHVPELGRQVGENPMFRRHLHGDLAIFYRMDPDAIALLRIIEQQPVGL